LQWTRLLPTEEPTILVGEPSGPSKDIESTLVLIPITLALICGLFSGAFIVGLLIRRIVIALAVAGPLIFSSIWIWREWAGLRDKKMAVGAFALGFTLTFLALDREP
jgi:hypothetical protein